MITFTVVASTRRTSRTLNSCSRPNNTDVASDMLVAPLLDVVRDQQHVGATSPSPATTRASTHPAQVRRTALASDGPPQYMRVRSGSLVDAYEPRIRELLAAFPRMPATVIGERVGWPFSIRTLSGRVAELRPAYLPPDPASRTAYTAGEIAQCDFWFPDIELPVGLGQTRTARLLP